MTDPEKAETAELTLIQSGSEIGYSDAAEEIARLNDEIARLTTENAALHRERAEEKQIAEEILAAKRDEEDLKKRSKAAKERAEHLSEALMARTRGDVQTDIGDIKDPDDQQHIPFSGEDLDAKRDAGDILELAPDAITWAALEVAAISQTASTGKPQKVKPIEHSGNLGKHPLVALHVVARVVTLLPIYTADEFVEKFGTSPLAIPNETRTAELEALGPHAGIPVKVNRKIYHLAPDKEALLVRMPEEVKVGAVADGADDEHDGGCIDYGLIANRVRVCVETWPDDAVGVSVSMAAQSLKLAPATVHAAVENADNMGFFDPSESDPVIELL